ncbi:MAG TPA: site-specific integrase [Ktedonobacteraceae bacterium]|nr:site-specific integrase [Ktedonobacteraceae bacterium]
MEYEVIPVHSTLDQVGQSENVISANNAFKDYHDRIDPNTFARQSYDMALFCAFIASKKVLVDKDELLSSPRAWLDITHGMIDSFAKWMIEEGFAIGSINIRLSTVKTYFKLASRAGYIQPDEAVKAHFVKGYSYKQGLNVDERREIKRKDKSKKAEPIPLTKEQTDLLKKHPNTPQGRRDALLMCLLLDHGLRCGEVADLTRANIQLTSGILTFHREKTKEEDKHKLTNDTLVALMRYFEVYHPTGKLIAGSHRSGQLMGEMSRRAITKRVQVLGEQILGIKNLSAHDCRHAWVEAAIRGGTNIKTLQQAGGWSSPAMPLRYAAKAEISNEGVKLG